MINFADLIHKIKLWSFWMSTYLLSIFTLLGVDLPNFVWWPTAGNGRFLGDICHLPLGACLQRENFRLSHKHTPFDILSPNLVDKLLCSGECFYENIWIPNPQEARPQGLNFWFLHTHISCCRAIKFDTLRYHERIQWLDVSNSWR